MDKTILNTENYDFLNTERFLKHNKVWYLAPIGNSAKGIESDETITKGVFMNSKANFNAKGYNGKSYCINKFGKLNPEIELHPVIGLCDLVYNCDVNTINMFGVRDEDILIMTDEGKWIRDNVIILLSKQRVYNSYKKYAEEKTEKFNRIILRNSDTMESKEVLKNELDEKISSLKKRYKNYDENMKVYIAEDDLMIDLNFQKFPVKELNCIMSELKDILRGYNDFKGLIQENEAMYMYATDAVSTYLIGIDILNGNGINVYREKELKLLNDIKNRKIHHDKILEIINDLSIKFKLAKQVSKLADDVDYNNIKDLLIGFNKAVLNKA